MSDAGHLGITVGNTRSVAVHRVRAEDEPTVVVVPTTLRFDEDGRAHLGEPAETAPFTRFVDLVGQQENREPDAAVYRAEDLMANAANCLVSMMTAEGESADTPVTTMTYPARWPRECVALLRDALDHTGLAAVALVPDAKAASTFAQRNPGTGATVIDIGATGTDISTYPGGGTVRTTAVSGDVFTDALFDHVVTDREHIDLSDAAVRAALAGVVASCEAAKHALSTDEDAVISVDLPGQSQSTTVTRAEFADLVAPSVRTLDVPQAGTVVLTGGSAVLEPVATEIAERSSGRLVVEPLAAPRGALLLAEVDDVDGNSLVTGAAPIVTRNDGNDAADTDAIPVVPQSKSLAFSEAFPAVVPVFETSGFRSQPIEQVDENESHTGAVAATAAAAPTEPKNERSERSRTIATIVAGAAAGVVIVLAIAAVSGVFGSDPAAPPPAVTDAGLPVVTSTRAPVTTTVPPAPAVIAPEVVDEPTVEQFIPPQPAPLPVPPPAPIPAPPPVVETTADPVPTTTATTTTPAETTTPAATTTTAATPTPTDAEIVTP
ncbi:Hsp70 family protein [Rhodococcus sp. NPDC078407]|uniref:Hsp70 family protein n=1 Tax=Rhodococcus sp. NPDC078407 TaxID=3364509 RepID=UPI0037C7FB80